MNPAVTPYPEKGTERDRWIMEQRPARAVLDPRRPVSFFVEDECSESGEILPIATVFLTNRECPWRCVMCDLWKNTLTQPVDVGDVPAQIDYALAQLPAARQIKLYNSGSFFDRRAIPAEDYAGIAARVRGFERVIVECHPGLINESCLRFRDLLFGPLEVAMGLETVHPEILPRLNKRMSLEQFSKAAEFLRANGIDLRVFILVQPPFMREEDAVEWAERSLAFAFDCGATAATLIPTRGGNGAMETLAAQGEFARPRLASLETAMQRGLAMQRGRVFSDLWDVRGAECEVCFGTRVALLREMNLRQRMVKRVACERCGN